MPKEVKERYEERAKIIAAEQAAKAKRTVTDDRSQFPVPSPSADSQSMSPHPSARPTTPGKKITCRIYLQIVTFVRVIVCVQRFVGILRQ